MDIKNLLGHRYFGLIVLFYVGVITWISLASISITIDNDFIGIDKIGHLLAYFVFMLIVFVFLFYSKKVKLVFDTSLLIASILVFGYGVLMEFFQAILTTYRSADWYDVFANTTGVLFGVFILKLLQNKIIKIKTGKSST